MHKHKKAMCIQRHTKDNTDTQKHTLTLLLLQHKCSVWPISHTAYVYLPIYFCSKKIRLRHTSRKQNGTQRKRETEWQRNRQWVSEWERERERERETYRGKGKDSDPHKHTHSCVYTNTHTYTHTPTETLYPASSEEKGQEEVQGKTTAQQIAPTATLRQDKSSKPNSPRR